MKCKCGNDRFKASQICRVEIIVDEDGVFEENLMGTMELSVYDSETPYAPFICTKCNAEYDSLDD